VRRICEQGNAALPSVSRPYGVGAGVTGTNKCRQALCAPGAEWRWQEHSVASHRRGQGANLHDASCRVRASFAFSSFPPFTSPPPPPAPPPVKPYCETGLVLLPKSLLSSLLLQIPGFPQHLRVALVAQEESRAPPQGEIDLPAVSVHVCVERNF